jgi:cold shock CspA family protein
MTNRISSHKREREKSKQQKRLEKQKRKEERRSQGKSSFEDMIAYMDEYGGFHENPQDIVKDDVKAEDIEVSTPKKEDVEESEAVTLNGVVDYFDEKKGYGFIQAETGHERFFFHISNAPEEIEIGDKVSFQTEDSPRGKNAIHITIVSR